MTARRAALAAVLLLGGCAHDPFPAAPRTKPIRPPAGRAAADCTRAPLRPLLKSGGAVLSTNFRRLSPHEARETARLRGSILLTVTHDGCTRTGYVFRFRLPERPRPFTARKYWYRRAARLMEAIGIEGLRDMTAALRRTVSAPPPYGTWIKVGDYQRIAVSTRSERRAAIVEVRYGTAL